MGTGLKSRVLTALAAVVPALVKESELREVRLSDGRDGVTVEIFFTEDQASFRYISLWDGSTDLVEIVDYLFQELQDFMSETSFAWSEARPPCPGHSHPRRLALEDGALWWLCPSGDPGRKERAFPELAAFFSDHRG
ncbi:hypothetical protein [Actinomadura violacea]|uniref:Uncharacterized protein n=1 Tax=Actinomadura violacea TaxID=2819934 RepID=A0ABS3RP81_9ACTN|nr:hypothetical protein [Actinomadura violacea]MBO2458550.1 hypothetical protein [Actinomadura violacea]